MALANPTDLGHEVVPDLGHDLRHDTHHDLLHEVHHVVDEGAVGDILSSV